MLMTDSNGGSRLFCAVLWLWPIQLLLFCRTRPKSVSFTSLVSQEPDPWTPIMKGHEAQLWKSTCLIAHWHNLRECLVMSLGWVEVSIQH